MKPSGMFFVIAAVLAALPGVSVAQVPSGQDTIRIPGGTLAGRENAGGLEATINGDTTVSGARLNPNRVYALNEGQYYYQLAPIFVNNPTGTLTICGVPSTFGTTKPIILIAPQPPAAKVGDYTVNVVYGSVKCENIHYQAMQLNGALTNELFMCGTASQLPQSLTINNCLFEFCNIDLFDCSNESGAIGGWPYGAKFRLTNSYFRNLFNNSQWWGSRIFQCKHPIDTLWVENCTVTGGGLTFLQSNQLTDVAYFNHNTIVNNKKNWLTSPYYRQLFVTSNIFLNQNWVGEDTNIIGSSSAGILPYSSTIHIDSVSSQYGVIVQPRYQLGDAWHYSPLLNLNQLRVFVSDNVTYNDPLIANGYYRSPKYVDSTLGTPPSYLNWGYFGSGPWRINNQPGQWMNAHTQALFAAYGAGKGGFKEKRTCTIDPGTVTRGIADAAVVDSMAAWNQNLWGDPRFPNLPHLDKTKYIFGDYDPKTLPGIVNGVKSDTLTSGSAGITKFTDLTEDFSQSLIISAIDGLPVGSLIWNDAAIAAFNSESDRALVYSAYIVDGIPIGVAMPSALAPEKFALAQNYPNPFNPTTTIRYFVGGVVAPSGAFYSGVEGPPVVASDQWPVTSVVRIIVYDVLGREVAVLVNDKRSAGTYDVQFDGARLASGVYYYRLSAGNFVATRSMIVLK